MRNDEEEPPTFKPDAEAERFVDTADLSKYDLSGLKPSLAFVKGLEMAEIKANKRLVEHLRKGSQDAKRKKGALADHRSRSYR